jgi:hypothetical protein
MGLLSMLFGGGNTPPPGVPPHRWGTDADGYLVPQMAQPQPGAMVQQAATQAPAAPSNQMPQAQAQAQPSDPNAPITVTGSNPDNWKPRHNGFLGQLADYVLGTHTGSHIHRLNMEDAMQSILSNPDQALRRMAKFDPEEAEKFYNTVVDNKRMQQMADRQNSVLDLQRDRYADGMIGNMMYSVYQNAKNGQVDPAQYQAMRNRAIEVGNRYGKDYASSIPETPDINDAQSFGMGVMPASRQAAVAATERGQDMTAAARAASLKERAGFHQGELGLGQDRVDIGRENAGSAAENADAHSKGVANQQQRFNETHQGKTVQSPGRPGHGQVANDGQTMVWYMPDGSRHLYLRGQDGQHWVYSHKSVAPKSK